jgi:hypothetical protein
MAGHSRPKDGVAFARLCPAIHVLVAPRKDVDARDKPGHDGLREGALSNSYTGSPFCFASSFSDTCGRAPMCWITSAAASAPRRPAFS